MDWLRIEADKTAGMLRAYIGKKEVEPDGIDLSVARGGAVKITLREGKRKRDFMADEMYLNAKEIKEVKGGSKRAG